MRVKRWVVSGVAFVSFCSVFASSVFACSSFGADDGPSTMPPADDGGVGEAAAVPAEGGAPRDGAPEAAPTEDASLSASVVLSQGWTSVLSIAADETYVYFTEQGSGFVHAVSLELAAPLPSKTIGSPGAPTSIAVAGGYVYWCDGATGVLSQAGPTGTIMSDLPQTDDATFVVTATATQVLSLTHHKTDTAQGGVELRSPTSFKAAQGLTAAGGNPFDITLFQDAAYWTESGGGVIAKTSLTSVGRTVAAPAEQDCRFITSDASGVYWTRTTSGVVRGMLNGGGAQDIAPAETAPTAIASDGKAVYWVNGDGTIRRLREGTKKVETIASGFMPVKDQHAHALAVTSTYVVWLTEDGKVLRHDK